MGLLIKSTAVLLLCTVLMAGIAKLGVFNRTKVAIGYHTYAEKALKNATFKLPLNTAVNIGYVLVGLYWLWNARSLKLSRVDLFYLDVFSIIGIIYGPVQLARTVFQSHLLAVLDQWMILPFFAWVYIWGYHFLDNLVLTRRKLVTIMMLSVASYSLTLFTPNGYTYALVTHILLSLLTAIALQRQHGNNVTMLYIFYGIFLCTGYIGFKVIDFHLVNVHQVFTRISGHFLSRVCDVLKIHVAALYFVENVKAAHDYCE